MTTIEQKMKAKTYYLRKEQGLCTMCGKETERTKSGKIRCIECEDIVKNNRRYRDKLRRNKGLCLWCGQPSEERLCPKCREKEHEYAKRARQWRKELTRKRVNGKMKKEVIE